MDLTGTQIIDALDSYMQNNGGGAKYVAVRMNKIFDDKNAPLNAKSGTLATLAKAGSTFAKQIDKLSNKIDSELKDFTKVLKNVKTASLSIQKTIDTLVLDLKKNKMANVGDIKQKNLTSRNNSAIETQTFSLFFSSFVKTISKTSLPVSITSVHPSVISAIQLQSKKESLFNELARLDRKDDRSPTYNQYSNFNNIDAPDPKASSIFSKILKWGALISGAIFAAPYLEKFLDKTTIGNKIKTFTDTIFQSLGKLVDGFFNGGKDSFFTKSTSSFISIVARIGQFIFGGISDTITRNKASIYESLGSIGSTIVDKLIRPSLSWIGEKLSKGEFLNLASVWLIARFTPILGSFIKIAEKGLIRSGQFLGSKLIGLFRGFALPSTATMTTAMASLRSLGPFLGRLGVIGGIIVAGGIAIERLHETGKIISNTINTLREKAEIEANNYKSIAEKHKNITEKRSNSLKDWEELEKKRSLSSFEKIQKNKAIEEAKIASLIKSQSEIAAGKLPIMPRGAQLSKDTLLRNIQIKIQESRKKIQGLDSESKKVNLIMPNPQKDKSSPIVIEKESKPIIDLSSIPLANNKKMEEKMGIMIDLLAQNVQATVQSGGRVAQTVAATAASKTTAPTTPSFGNSDPIRDQRNRANSVLSSL